MLTTRGSLLSGEDPNAIDDFKRAIQQDGKLVWPYYFLAHHAVVTGDFDQCRRFCERGLEMEGSDSIKSELAEGWAIAQSRLGFPDPLVRSSFELSLRLNPSNEEARRNFAASEAAAHPIRPGLYETRSEATIRTSGLSERRLNRVA